MAEKISLKERPAPGFEKPGWFSWFQPPPVTKNDIHTPAYEFQKDDVDAQKIVKTVYDPIWNSSTGKWEKPADGGRTKKKSQQKNENDLRIYLKKSKKKSKRKSKKKSQGKKK